MKWVLGILAIRQVPALFLFVAITHSPTQSDLTA